MQGNKAGAAKQRQETCLLVQDSKTGGNGTEEGEGRQRQEAL